jgi:hypothetical protein
MNDSPLNGSPLNNSPLNDSGCRSPRGFQPGPLLVAIPYLIGYDPAESLVLIFVDDSGAIATTMRVDWCDAVADPSWVARDLWQRAQRSGAVSVLVVSHRAGGRECLAAITVLGECLSDAGAVVDWSGWVDGRRWRSSTCDADGCRDHELPDPAASRHVAQLVAGGCAPAADRARVAEEVAPCDPGQCWGPLVIAPEADREAWRSATVDAMEVLLRAGLPLEDHDMALVAAVRDTVLHRLTIGSTADRSAEWATAWRQLAAVLRRAPQGFAAPVGAVAALAAWQFGDGLRAGMALGRARADDPDHGLTRLMRDVLDRALPPWAWDSIMAGLTESECRYGGARRRAA